MIEIQGTSTIRKVNKESSILINQRMSKKVVRNVIR